MKRRSVTMIALSLVALLLGACVPVPTPSPAAVASPAAGPSPLPVGGWNYYTDAEAGFSIEVPPIWSRRALPEQSGGAIHGMIFTGAEGGVEVYWGVGFGGACPTGTQPVQLAQGQVPACHVVNTDGTETWSQIGYEADGGNAFSVRAYTADAQPASHDLVLQVLATLTFMPLAPGPDWQLYVDAEAGFSLLMPPTWSSEALPDQNGGAIHGTAFTGPEGVVEVYWGGGLGGACPNGTEPVWLAQGELPACHSTTPEGTEVWSQISYELEGAFSYGVRAYTNDAEPSSHDLVLQVLATLAFQPEMVGLANPASVNCSEQGGTSSIEERDDGSQIGVCTFEDNMQCEEWALFWGKCPVGGVKVTGYVTQAARYCAITGGEYAITDNEGAKDEKGTCILPDGTECDAWYYYDHGTCNDLETKVITYAPGPPTGEPQEGKCWTNSLAVWREDAWRCTVGNSIYDPCFFSGGGVICGASPITETVGFLLLLTEPLPAPEVPPDTAGHAWLVELADGTVCEYATGATGGVGADRINYFCPSPDPSQYVVILGDLQPGNIWMAKRAVLTGGPPDPTVLESAEVPIRTVWR
jgi:hypothetical protein